MGVHHLTLPCCITIARPLLNIRRLPLTPPFCAIHHTILVMAISCKGQAPPPVGPVGYAAMARVSALKAFGGGIPSPSDPRPIHTLQGNLPDSCLMQVCPLPLTRDPSKPGTPQGNTPDSCAPLYAGIPSPSDLRPIHTLQGSIPDSCTPSYAGMPSPSDPRPIHTLQGSIREL